MCWLLFANLSKALQEREKLKKELTALETEIKEN